RHSAPERIGKPKSCAAGGEFLGHVSLDLLLGHFLSGIHARHGGAEAGRGLRVVFPTQDPQPALDLRTVGGRHAGDFLNDFRERHACNLVVKTIRASPLAAQKNFLALSNQLCEVGWSASPLTLANSSRILRCSELRLCGTSTCTRTSWSPWERPRNDGMPLPRRRKVVPL